MNIFIAGCARSGTSVTRGLMECFDGVYAHGGYTEGQERRASAFEEFAGRAPHIVLKRTASCRWRLPFLRKDVGVIYCVRHPCDVLTSSHRETERKRRFHVTAERWISEYGAFRLLRRLQPQRRIFVLRYEDLINDPDGLQDRLASHFGLVASHRFANNPSGVRLQADSLEKWRRDPDLLAYCTTFGRFMRGLIERFSREFDYRLPEASREAHPTDWLSRSARAGRISGQVRRLPTSPIIRPRMLPVWSGGNINGPSLIAAPDWLPHRLGSYYLYFAHHRGKYIRLAYADRLEGPWTLHRGGTLHLGQATMCRNHIASPDVHVDEENRQIRMYFHGRIEERRAQKSFVAISDDGITFSSRPEALAAPYLRCLPWNGQWLGLAMDGHFYRSADGLTNFERNPTSSLSAFPRGVFLRHVALRIVGSTLEVYYTRAGEIGERIWRGFIDLEGDWSGWRLRDTELILAPEMKWEGGDCRPEPSRFGPARRRERALRDPAIFAEDGRNYLLYATAGEAGIAIAELPTVD